MSELEQWCEIDGHNWLTYYSSHGLVLGPKIVNMGRICQFCKTTENRTFETDNQPLSMYTVLTPPLISPWPTEI